MAAVEIAVSGHFILTEITYDEISYNPFYRPVESSDDNFYKKKLN